MIKQLAPLALFCISSFTHAEEASDIDPVLNDPCQNGEAIKLEHALGYTSEEGYSLDNVFIDCKELPYDRYTAIIAVLLPSRIKDRFEQNGNLDLHLIQINAVGEIMRQQWFSDVSYTGGMQLSGPIIDTGRYSLKTDLRAFGLRTFNQSHCSACEADIEEESLNLFYPTDSGFRWVVRGMIVGKNETEREANDHKCYNAGEEQNSVIQLATSKSHDLFDLVIVTTTSEVPGDEEFGGKSCTKRLPDKKQRQTWRFDGEQYRLAPK